MEKEKNLRQRLREMKVGETIKVSRLDYKPSTVRVSAYAIGQDYGMKFSARKKQDYELEVERIA